jgi:hypothetical protein
VISNWNVSRYVGVPKPQPARSLAGGTLLPPGPTFQSVCQDYGGEYRASYIGLSYTVAPACLWWGVSWDTWASAAGPLTNPPLCPDWDSGAEWAPSVDPDYAGC